MIAMATVSDYVKAARSNHRIAAYFRREGAVHEMRVMMLATAATMRRAREHRFDLLRK